MNTNQVALNKQRIEKAFNDLNLNTLDSLDSFYDENIEFSDPIVKVKGLKAAKNYYAHVYKNVTQIKFEFKHIHCDGDHYFAKWFMHLQVKGLNGHKPYTVEGISELQFGSNNKVIFHRDYLDIGAMVYERLPIIGSLIQKIKSKLNHS
jgi:limonene-1,2-epoxide hydrolase